jgi:hypothetical protein
MLEIILLRYQAVLLSVFLCQVFGALYYSPLLFGGFFLDEYVFTQAAQHHPPTNARALSLSLSLSLPWHCVDDYVDVVEWTPPSSRSVSLVP